MARVKYYDPVSQEWKYADLAAGRTPVKGVDYFTEEDKQEIITEAKKNGILSYDKQELTEAQQEQARENIGAIKDELKENLDANNFRITNLPLPQSGSEPATKEFVENFTVEGSTYVATDDNKDGNIVLRPYVADEDELVFKGHIDNKNNPHEVTIGQIGAAPSGYGLGEVSPAMLIQTQAALNACITGGQYRFYGYENGSFWGIGGYSSGLIEVKGSRTATDGIRQFFYPDGIQCVLVRMLVGNVWQPWEWENPPLKPGVEYRTTRRYDDKPIYTKLIGGKSLAVGNTWISTGVACDKYARVLSVLDTTTGTEHMDSPVVTNAYIGDNTILIVAVESKTVNILIEYVKA